MNGSVTVLVLNYISIMLQNGSTAVHSGTFCTYHLFSLNSPSSSGASDSSRQFLWWLERLVSKVSVVSTLFTPMTMSVCLPTLSLIGEEVMECTSGKSPCGWTQAFEKNMTLQNVPLWVATQPFLRIKEGVKSKNGYSSIHWGKICPLLVQVG